MARGIDITRYDADAKALVKRLQTWSKDVRKDSQRILRPAGEVIRNEIRARAPVFPRRHYRYPKGGGPRMATYYPGNLRRAIDDLFLQQTSAVFIGPKRSGDTGAFSGTRADGFYARWVEFGAKPGRPRRAGSDGDDRGAPSSGIRPRRFIARGLRAGRPRAKAIIIRNLKQRLSQL